MTAVRIHAPPDRLVVVLEVFVQVVEQSLGDSAILIARVPPFLA